MLYMCIFRWLISSVVRIHRPMGSEWEFVIRDASFLRCTFANPPGWSLLRTLCFSQLETFIENGYRKVLKALVNMYFVLLWLKLMLVSCMQIMSGEFSSMKS